jgi:predicted O-methyltransferase YrrM
MVDISQALTVQGWMSPEELTWLAEMAAKIPAGGRIAEIGSHQGRSACALAGNTTGTLFCVDTWRENEPYGCHFDVFSRNTAHLSNIFPVHSTSIDAARRFAALGLKCDAIFLDADHTDYHVRQDILAWRPLLADGGVFAGHDYGNTDWPDVKAVVDELIPHIKVVGHIWIGE